MGWERLALLLVVVNSVDLKERTFQQVDGAKQFDNAHEDLALKVNGRRLLSNLERKDTVEEDRRRLTHAQDGLHQLNNLIYTVGGTVTGLMGPLRIRLTINEATNSHMSTKRVETKDLTPSDSTFQFSKKSAVGDFYDVDVIASPSGYECTVHAGGWGSFENNVHVTITCERDHTPLWFCVVNNGHVVDVVRTSDEAKDRLNELSKGQVEARAVFEVLNGVLTMDPHGVTDSHGHQQSEGSAAGWNKWWWNWHTINQLAQVAVNDLRCHVGPEKWSSAIYRP